MSTVTVAGPETAQACCRSPASPWRRLATAVTAWCAVLTCTVTDARAGTIPVDTAFTYQGQLRDTNGPIDGTASLRFRLFNQALGGIQVGPTLTACDLALVDGLLTVDLDFGMNVFDGSERWLEISVQSPAGNCSTFTTLSPRQPLTPAPYAIRSLAPWMTNGSAIHFDEGNVGIGTSTPATPLEISKPEATLRVTSTGAGGTSQLDLKGVTPSGLGSNVLGVVRFMNNTNAVRASISSAVGLFANALTFSIDEEPAMALSGAGNLGVGTTFPLSRIHAVGGTDTEPGSGGFLILGDSSSTNLSLDSNEIMARNNGAVSTLFLNHAGGDVSICAAGSGQVGIGTAPTSSQLTVFNSLFVNGGAQPRIDVGPNGFILMDNGADIILSNGGLEVNTPSGGQTFFNRTAPDGTLISFHNNGINAGGIAVFGSTVSYNTFTGSHNAWTEEPIEHGTLVRLTGNNRRAHPGANCEPVYGVAPTSFANDPCCLGAYLGAPDPSDPGSHHLVAAVGNGEVWVVDSGAGGIAPGDALISADVAGSAMQDDPTRFRVGHVIARAAEPVDWSAIRADADGVKRVLLSVFFDSFERQGDAAAFDAVVGDLREENALLLERVDALEQQVTALMAALEGRTR